MGIFLQSTSYETYYQKYKQRKEKVYKISNNSKYIANLQFNKINKYNIWKVPAGKSVAHHIVNKL